MRQAIVTKYLEPTTHRGARIRAKSEVRSITVPWDYTMNNTDNYRAAAVKLILDMGWGDPSEWHGGCLPDGGYVFVRVTEWSGLQVEARDA